jgi:hypothetical protein
MTALFVEWEPAISIGVVLLGALALVAIAEMWRVDDDVDSNGGPWW